MCRQTERRRRADVFFDTVRPKFKHCLRIPAPTAFSSGLDYDDEELYTSYCMAVFNVHITPLRAKFLIRSTAMCNSDGRQIIQYVLQKTHKKYGVRVFTVI